MSNDIELPNKDLLYISFDTLIPPQGIFGVGSAIGFTLKIDENVNIAAEENAAQKPDPSTIYVHLPITEDYKVDKLPYWPSYRNMTSGQRFVYLSWLRDVTQPIEIGYVFVYYYGLERKMLTENFDRAFDEIVRLRQYHNNKSFLKYSEDALVHAAIMRKRFDRLLNLHELTEITHYSNALFAIAYKSKTPLGAIHLAFICCKYFPPARKALKDNRELFVACIEETLATRCPNGIIVGDYDISMTKEITETRFINYSFSYELSHIKVIDFYQCKALMLEIENIYKASYELYKQRKRKQRVQ